MGCDMAGVALGALVVCGAAIHDDIKLQPKQHDKRWLEFRAAMGSACR